MGSTRWGLQSFHHFNLKYGGKMIHCRVLLGFRSVVALLDPPRPPRGRGSEQVSSCSVLAKSHTHTDSPRQHIHTLLQSLSFSISHHFILSKIPILSSHSHYFSLSLSHSSHSHYRSLTLPLNSPSLTLSLSLSFPLSLCLAVLDKHAC